MFRYHVWVNHPPVKGTFAEVLADSEWEAGGKAIQDAALATCCGRGIEVTRIENLGEVSVPVVLRWRSSGIKTG